MSAAPPRSGFRDSLFNPGEFTLTFELVPSRGGKSTGQSRILDLASAAAADGRLHAVSITENAGGHPVLSPEVLGVEIQAMGLDVIAHFSCKDKNRNQMESLLFAWDRIGLRNLLVLTGDYPQKGFMGHPKPVFDLDVVQALDLIGLLNQGRDSESPPQSSPRHHPAGFLRGVAVSPFKRLAAEQILQYQKLRGKIAAGADYAITQLGYDARKFHELLLFLRQAGLAIPILGNVFVPNPPVIEMLRRGEIPGCHLPDRVYHQMKDETSAPDRGKGARLLRAARLAAILKGMGYDGVHIGGPGLTSTDLAFILHEAAAHEGDWQSLIPQFDSGLPETAYLYERDDQSGLNLPVGRPLPLTRHLHSPHFHFARLSHDHMFEKDGLLYLPMKAFCLGVEKIGDEAMLVAIEHFIKMLLFGCQNCGDCRLADFAFLCPQSECAKFLFNGPCGGSLDGWCEVHPGTKRCFFLRVLERLPPGLLEESLASRRLPPREWLFDQRSTWIRFFKEMESH